MTGPIFITGGSRCGTELARSLLNQHPMIHIAVETHYFDDPRPRLLDPAAPSIDEAEMLLDYFLRVSGHGYGLQTGNVNGSNRDNLRARWAARGRHADALFAAFCEEEAQRNGKVLWGEKTPRHLFRIEEMLGAFPDAKVIICLRDPRAAVASYRDWRNNWGDRNAMDQHHRRAVEVEEARARQSFNLTVATLLWRSAASTAQRALERLGEERIFVLRFETLLDEPEETVRSLTQWLGLPFDADMLAVAVRNSSYAEGDSIKGIHSTTAQRWRSKLSSDEQGYIQWLTTKQMKMLGYDAQPCPLSLAYALVQIAGLPFELLRIMRVNRSRIGSWSHFLRARLRGLR